MPDAEHQLGYRPRRITPAEAFTHDTFEIKTHMRGNHRLWFRNDYTPPPALPVEQLARVRSVTVTPKEGTKTWNEVWSNGLLIGYVTSRTYGQSFRRPHHDGWVFAANDHCDGEPPHARAILALLDDVEADCSIVLGTVI